MCGVADITQQHTCQVTTRSARLECRWLAGWLWPIYRTVAAAWIERRPRTSSNIALLKEGRRGTWAEHVTRMGRGKNILEPDGVTTRVTLLHVGEYY
jgi:hypothetical protein